MKIELILLKIVINLFLLNHFFQGSQIQIIRIGPNSNANLLS